MAKLQDIFRRETIVFNLKATTKEDAIKELVLALTKHYKFLEGKNEIIVEAILNRERLGSTGIGNNIAIPHAKISNLARWGVPVIGILGSSKKGIDFNSVDGGNVNIIFLIIGDDADNKAYLEVLSLIAKAVQQPNFCRFLRQAKNVEEIEEIIKDVDEKIGQKIKY